MRQILKFFDKLEDRVRSVLSRHPIIYSIIGGVAIVLFWRGVWITADLFPFMTGPVSILLSLLILLLTGLFASFFVGDQIIISGLKHDKKVIDKTKEEIQEEAVTLLEVKKELKRIESEVEHIDEDLHKRR